MKLEQSPLLYLANPRGFCAGVDRAIDIVKRALQRFGPPIYVRHEVVHNRYVVNELADSGAIFVDELDEVPDDAIVIFSAHGVSDAVVDEAKRRCLHVLDATCPLVTKVHMEVIRYARKNQECILIGHANHPEVEGTLGRYRSKNGNIYLVETVEDVMNLDITNADQLGYVTQTTLSVDDTQKIINALKQRFPNIEGPKRDDICYATQNRQDAVKELAKQCDVVLVIGSTNSSNSNRLRELAERCGCDAYLIDSPDQLELAWFAKANSIGITAGASAPEILVQNVVNTLKIWGAKSATEVKGVEEKVTFPLPRELRDVDKIA